LPTTQQQQQQQQQRVMLGRIHIKSSALHRCGLTPKVTNMTTTTAVNEKEWPVHVYRKTEQAWQKMQPTNSHGRTVVIKATPRRSCIVLHRIQVRIRLSASSNTNSNNDSTSQKEPDESNTFVVRRRDCILISSSQRLRSLVLRFRDEKACLEFSDLLVTLNPPPERAILAGTNDETTEHASNYYDTREHGTIQDRQQVLSYVGRLLHDENFAELVDNLESCISSSEDGARMLFALVNGATNVADGSESLAE
jgi:hypothetical protein